MALANAINVNIRTKSDDAANAKDTVHKAEQAGKYAANVDVGSLLVLNSLIRNKSSRGITNVRKRGCLNSKDLTSIKIG